MVVGEGDKVEVRQITATQAIGDKWLVTEGLKTGDRVIITGLQKSDLVCRLKRRKSFLTINSKPQATLSQNNPSLNLNRSR